MAKKSYAPSMSPGPHHVFTEYHRITLILPVKRPLHLLSLLHLCPYFLIPFVAANPSGHRIFALLLTSLIVCTAPRITSILSFIRPTSRRSFIKTDDLIRSQEATDSLNVAFSFPYRRRRRRAPTSPRRGRRHMPRLRERVYMWQQGGSPTCCCCKSSHADPGCFTNILRQTPTQDQTYRPTAPKTPPRTSFRSRQPFGYPSRNCRPYICTHTC